jgi:hypothetical protein
MLKTRPRSILYNTRPVHRLDLCPGCGRPWPFDWWRYRLERDGVRWAYCPRCGFEAMEGGHEA